jgi:hypothetical protein
MILDLPLNSKVNKVVPKNAFDDYTNPRQKRKFTELISKLTWLNKLSFETINIKGKDVKEIQVFQVDLKKPEGFGDVLQVIDKAIPYHIVFCIYFKEQVMFLASQKHLNPINEDIAVVDWSFTSKWIDKLDNSYKLNLERSLDFVFFDFCKQLLGKEVKASNVSDLISYDKTFKELYKAISMLEATIGKTKQFNKKVELNLLLQVKKGELNKLIT